MEDITVVLIDSFALYNYFRRDGNCVAQLQCFVARLMGILEVETRSAVWGYHIFNSAFPATIARRNALRSANSRSMESFANDLKEALSDFESRFAHLGTYLCFRLLVLTRL